MLIPRVNNLARAEGRSLLPYRLTLCVGAEFEARALKLISLLLPEAAVTAADDAVITASFDKALAPEAYKLEIAGNKVSIVCSDYMGLRNAVATLSVAVNATAGGYSVDNMQIEDAPVCSHRGIMLDLARGVKDYDRLLQDLVLIAKARMNIVHLHLFDSPGCCMYLESIPESALLEGYYSKAQMMDLVAFADVLGLELIPEFDMPAHSIRLLEVQPEYGCELPEGVVRSYHVTCTGTEAVYKMYENVIAELAAIFPGRYMHIGGDELEFADLGDEYICHWDVCPKCARFRREHSIADRQDQLYYFTNRINAMVKQHGKQTMIWSDQVDCMREVKLDRDILFHFWRVAHPGRGPHKGCSMNAQLSFGFDVVNSYYPETYLDLEPPHYNTSSASLRVWNWLETPECEAQYKKQILGAEMCAWDYGEGVGYGHYEHSLPSAAVIFGDKLWNGDILPYSKAYSVGLTKTVLGAATPAELDVYESIGDLIPPRDAQLIREGDAEKLAYPERVTVDDAALKKTLSLLAPLVAAGGASGRRAAAYAKCVQFVLDSRK